MCGICGGESLCLGDVSVVKWMSMCAAGLAETERGGCLCGSSGTILGSLCVVVLRWYNTREFVYGSSKMVQY